MSLRQIVQFSLFSVNAFCGRKAAFQWKTHKINFGSFRSGQGFCSAPSLDCHPPQQSKSYVHASLGPLQVGSPAHSELQVVVGRHRKGLPLNLAPKDAENATKIGDQNQNTHTIFAARGISQHRERDRKWSSFGRNTPRRLSSVFGRATNLYVSGVPTGAIVPEIPLSYAGRRLLEIPLRGCRYAIALEFLVISSATRPVRRRMVSLCRILDAGLEHEYYTRVSRDACLRREEGETEFDQPIAGTEHPKAQGSGRCRR